MLQKTRLFSFAFLKDPAGSAAAAFSADRPKNRLRSQITASGGSGSVTLQFTHRCVAQVGFARCETIAIPSHSSRGFQRPLQVFSKVRDSHQSETSFMCPNQSERSTLCFDQSELANEKQAICISGQSEQSFQ